MLIVRPVVETVVRSIRPAVSALPVATTASSALLVSRGGGGAGGAALQDLTRTRLRLEGLHQYGVVAALLMNAALRLFSSTPKKLTDADRRVDRVAKVVFTFAVALSTVLGSYTTIVFALLGLYSKRSLGMGHDDEFLRFFAATTGIRETGFDAFLGMLICFKASFLLSLFLNYEGNPRLRWWVSGLVLAVDMYAWWNWSTIFKLADDLLLIRDF